MTKPQEEAWTVVSCGNPSHGPKWKCWKVKDRDGNAILSSVNKETAERHAAIPDMARALKKMLQVGRRRNSEVVEAHTTACWNGIRAYHTQHGNTDCEEIHAALTKAGVPLT